MTYKEAAHLVRAASLILVKGGILESNAGVEVGDGQRASIRVQRAQRPDVIALLSLVGAVDDNEPVISVIGVVAGRAAQVVDVLYYRRILHLLVIGIERHG